MLYYEWASDPFTEEVGQILAEKVSSGVEVKVLYDPVGSLTVSAYEARKLPRRFADSVMRLCSPLL